MKLAKKIYHQDNKTDAGSELNDCLDILSFTLCFLSRESPVLSCLTVTVKINVNLLSYVSEISEINLTEVGWSLGEF